MNIKNIIEKIKLETNNSESIIIRNKKMGNKTITIIFNEPLTSSNKISDFIIRSLNKISARINIYSHIKNEISNFKYNEIQTYDEIVFYLNRGFTIILVSGNKKCLALETKALTNRAVGQPTSENTIRGSKDSFVEDIQINIGLIKKRIKSNDLWEENIYVGDYTQTKITILSINNLADKNLTKYIKNKIKNINTKGIVDGEIIKNSIEKKSKVLPTIITTERPDNVCNALLEGRIVIIIDNTCFALILPAVLNDFFRTAEDSYGKNVNVSITRALKYIALFIAVAAPGIYIAFINYNQEIVPTNLLVSFSIQRDGVPFPAFIEAFIMIFSFEIVREADLRVPTSAGGALSLVGALILGEAAVSASIVSPIMMIVIASSAICSLPFSEFEFINAIRFYRILFMIGGTTFGIIGIVLTFLFVIIKLNDLTSFKTPYLMPFVPIDKTGLKNSVIKSKSLISYPNSIDKRGIYEKD